MAIAKEKVVAEATEVVSRALEEGESVVAIGAVMLQRAGVWLPIVLFAPFGIASFLLGFWADMGTIPARWGSSIWTGGLIGLGVFVAMVAWWAWGRLVVTDRRLLFVGVSPFSNRAKGILWEQPLDQVTLLNRKQGVFNGRLDLGLGEHQVSFTVPGKWRPEVWTLVDGLPHRQA